MKDCDKRNSHLRSRLHVIYKSSNNGRHLVTKSFAPLHPIELHSSSLHMSTLHFFLFKFHQTTLHELLILFSPI